MVRNLLNDYRLNRWLSDNNLELNILSGEDSVLQKKKKTALPPLTMNSTVATVESFRSLCTTISQALIYSRTLT